jgi:hypothetical protein
MAGAEVLARVLAQQDVGHVLLAVEVLADGDVFHLGRDDAAAGVVHLRHIGPALARRGLRCRPGKRRPASSASAARWRPNSDDRSGSSSVSPRSAIQPARSGQAGADVDAWRRVGVGAGAVIDEDRRVLLGAEGGGGVGLGISRIGTRMSGREPST